MDLRELEAAVHAWHAENFPDAVGHSYKPLLVALEELGELAHATIKEEQGIRHTKEECQEKAQDAVGDVVIALMGYCQVRGWTLTECLADAWERVSQRTRESLTVG